MSGASPTCPFLPAAGLLAVVLSTAWDPEPGDQPRDESAPVVGGKADGDLEPSFHYPADGQTRSGHRYTISGLVTAGDGRWVALGALDSSGTFHPSSSAQWFRDHPVLIGGDGAQISWTLVDDFEDDPSDWGNGGILYSGTDGEHVLGVTEAGTSFAVDFDGTIVDQRLQALEQSDIEVQFTDGHYLAEAREFLFHDEEIYLVSTDYRWGATLDVSSLRFDRTTMDITPLRPEDPSQTELRALLEASEHAELVGYDPSGLPPTDSAVRFGLRIGADDELVQTDIVTHHVTSWSAGILPVQGSLRISSRDVAWGHGLVAVAGTVNGAGSGLRADARPSPWSQQAS